TKDAGKEQPSTPAQAVQRLRDRLFLSSVPENLEKIAQEALGLKEQAGYADHAKALDKIAADARKKRDAILKEEEDEKERLRLARIEAGKRAWPKGTEPRVMELGRDEQYAAAARALGKKNEAYPEEWEKLRGWLANEVLLTYRKKARELTGEDKFDEARQAIAEMSKPEIVRLDPEIGKFAAGALDTLNAKEDKYRWDDILEAQEAARAEKVRAYLRSPVPSKRGKREASARVRWHVGDWPRTVTVKAEGDTAGLTVGGKPVGAPGSKVALAVKKRDELVAVKSMKGNGSVSLEQLLDGVEVLGAKLSVPGMKALPKYDELPAK
ncbi:MAG: hypothetical protein K2W96_09140, partial [Gemmataceae bacterium]|nr:hypothetical protein [Gemmataceae bacterium]